jgi:hypothetical protein
MDTFISGCLGAGSGARADAISGLRHEPSRGFWGARAVRWAGHLAGPAGAGRGPHRVHGPAPLLPSPQQCVRRPAGPDPHPGECCCCRKTTQLTETNRLSFNVLNTYVIVFRVMTVLLDAAHVHNKPLSLRFSFFLFAA